MPFLPGDVYTDKPMTQSAIKLFQGADGFVARSAAPRMPVTKLTGSYYKWKSADFNRNEMVVRGPSSPTRRSTSTSSTIPTSSRARRSSRRGCSG